jgi:hypothetical protein
MREAARGQWGSEVFYSAIGYLAGSLWVPNVGGLQEKRGFPQQNHYWPPVKRSAVSAMVASISMSSLGLFQSRSHRAR